MLVCFDNLISGNKTPKLSHDTRNIWKLRAILYFLWHQGTYYFYSQRCYQKSESLNLVWVSLGFFIVPLLLTSQLIIVVRVFVILLLIFALTPTPICSHSRTYLCLSMPIHAYPCSLPLTSAHSRACWCTNIYGSITKAIISTHLIPSFIESLFEGILVVNTSQLLTAGDVTSVTYGRGRYGCTRRP